MNAQRLIWAAFFLWLSSASVGNKRVHHYTFFGQDRERMLRDSAFLRTKRLEGAQVAYSWRQLEPQKDEYDFSEVREDLAFLSARGKKLFIQIQDVTFSPSRLGSRATW